MGPRVAAGLAAAPRALRTLLKDRAALRGGLFDPAYYRDVHMPAASWRPPLWHYLLEGRRAGASPHPLFDPHWYRAAYADVAASASDPAVHYATLGRGERRSPNPFHVAQGSRRPAGIAPEPGEAAPGGAPEAISPHVFLGLAAPGLVAYALHPDPAGREGVTSGPGEPEAPPVTEAAAVRIRRPRGGGEAALFVTHSADGRLKPHVRRYLDRLAREGIAVTLIVAADGGFHDADAALLASVDGLYVRENAGWDFAAWAHVLRLERRLLGSQALYWLNDSLIGPLDDDAFHALLQRVRAEPADVVGLTSNLVEGEHLQSYFLRLRSTALGAMGFQRFVHAVRALRTKHEVITRYEVAFSPAMQAAGLGVAALFPAQAGERDLTIFGWEALLERGFPFCKASLLTREEPGIDFSGVGERLSRYGFDIIRPPSPSLPAPRTVAPAEPRVGRDGPAKVALIGPWTRADGLGAASRGYLSALMHTGYACSWSPVADPSSAQVQVSPAFAGSDFASAADVAILQLDAEAWRRLRAPSHRGMFERARLRIGVLAQDVGVSPAAFPGTAGELDEIWVPGASHAASLQEEGSPPVHVVPCPVQLPTLRNDAAARARMRASLGLKPDTMVILCGLDASPALAREAALALVGAFARTRLARRGWRLLLAGEGAGELARAAGVLRMDRRLDREAAHALLETCDVYASLPAADGFGVAQAMAHAKVVVAPDAGSHADLLDASCGFPIASARMDQEALACALLAAAEMDGEARARLAAHARARVASTLSAAAVARRMEARIEALLARGDGL